jgi:hypothetical protein
MPNIVTSPTILFLNGASGTGKATIAEKSCGAGADWYKALRLILRPEVSYWITKINVQTTS